MLNADDCLAQLKALAASKDADAAALADGALGQFVTDAPAASAVHALGDLQSRLLREASPSPARADILDAIGDRIARLLDSGDAAG